MKKISLYTTIAILAILGLMITSCNKNEDLSSEQTAVAQDDAMAENLFDEVSDIADEAYNISIGQLKSTDDHERLFLGDCATVTLDTTVMPRVLTIDFGTENCLCNDGKYRRGKIIISFTGRYRHIGTVITHSFENYYVNDNNVEGTKVLTNMGFNENENLYFTIEVVGVIHKADNGGTLSWNSSRVREWVEGIETFQRRDDVYLITGTADGIRPDGSIWETEIMSALRVELNCRYIVSGTVEIRPENQPVRLLDFGEGECDNIATVTVNGETFTIYLH